MEIIKNFPAVSILICLFAGIFTSGMKPKMARLVNTFLVIVVLILSACTLYYTVSTGESFVYVMGKFEAPWGNEIRAGVLEALMATFFSVIMLLSLLGGEYKVLKDIPEDKVFLYYVLNDLLLSSLLALIYTNDMFTAYVFIEINTIAACGLIMIRQNGRALLAATRYIVMSQIGSGLVLMGLCYMYGITGHLLMSNIKEQVAILSASGEYHLPLLICISFLVVGLAIKSALYPFHAWLPDSYGYSTLSASAVLSSLVSKGYIFLLIKIFYRVVGFEIMKDTKILNVLFVFGIVGMIMGSIEAVRTKNLRRMVAFSSIAQIGYIYMGFGISTTLGMVAAVFHIISHASTKSALFIAADGLIDASGDSQNLSSMAGAGYRNVLAGVLFTVGAMSMVGFPLFAGFMAKIFFAKAALEIGTGKMMAALLALAFSTILNAGYFMKTVITIYTPANKVSLDTSSFKNVTMKDNMKLSIVMIVFVLLNLYLGLCSGPIVNLIETGLSVLS